jgi:uncharacterized BrkB/YihY/UPF0761 family membrane protein
MFVALLTRSDFPKLAEKLLDRKIFCRSEKKSPKKFTVMCIMLSLAFLECFTLVLAIGHPISPLVFIEVKVIKFLVFSVVQNCLCYVFYSVSSFVVFMTLYYRSMVVWKTSCHWLIYIQITNRVVIVFINGFGWNRKCIKGVKTMKLM